MDVPHLYTGKVRDMYDTGDDTLLIVATGYPKYVVAAFVSQPGIGRGRRDHQYSGLLIDLRGRD